MNRKFFLDILTFFSRSDVTIRKRLLVSIISVAVISILIVSSVNIALVSSIFSNAVWQDIKYEGKEKFYRIEYYFNKLYDNVATMSDSRYLQDVTIVLQNVMFSEGHSGEKDVVYGPTFKRVFEKHVERINNINESNVVGNLLLATGTGQVVFQSKGDQLLGKNLLKGQLKDSIFGDCFRKGLQRIVVKDYFYSSEMGAPVFMICNPIKTELERLEEGIKAGDIIGTIIVMADNAYVDQIMNGHKISELDESYLVSEHRKLLSPYSKLGSDSVASYLSTNKKMDSEAITLSFQGDEGTVLQKNFLGEENYTYYKQVKVAHEYNWVLISETPTYGVTRKMFTMVIAIFFSAFAAVGLGILLSLKITGTITRPLKNVADVIEGLSSEIVSGNWAVRANEHELDIDFRPLANRVNKLIDSFVDPLTKISHKVDQIGHGVIPEEFTEEWSGDFDKVRNNFNHLIDSLNALLGDVKGVAQKSSEGNLNERLDEYKHEGDFKSIAAAMNATLDAISQPLAEAVKVINAMAQRDLTLRVDGDFLGEWDRFKNNVNMANTNLRHAVVAFSGSTENISAESIQIGTVSQHLSQGAADQASSVQEISSSLSEIYAQSNQNAEKAGLAQELSNKAKDTAEISNQKMEKMQEAMKKINESSQSISQIVHVIDEIAFQINLLALNAAVEAARAGSHGKGFAVVAEEVRNLAARSAEAAKQTSELIEDSVIKVDAGSKMTEETAQGLKEILDGISKISILVSEISDDSQKQSASMQQINLATQQVNNVIQTTTAQALDIAKSGKQLASESSQLKSMISSFRLAG